MVCQNVLYYGLGLPTLGRVHSNLQEAQSCFTLLTRSGKVGNSYDHPGPKHGLTGVWRVRRLCNVYVIIIL